MSARVQITLPDTFLYGTEIDVRSSDLNYGAHVGHDRMLTLIQDARVSMYRSFGYGDERSFEGPVGQVIADAAVQYKSECFLGDVLYIEIGIGEWSRSGFDMYYRVTNRTTGKEAAIAKTGIVCFDYARRKVASIPESLVRNLKLEKKS
ncbi:MAG: thioesterase family protein [Chryseolinea sp.]